MTDALENRHGLEARTRAWPSDSGVSLKIRDDLGHLNLRGNPQDAGFLAAAEKVLGQALPQDPNTISTGASTIFWLGPDEWLVLAEAAALKSLAESLESALQSQHAAVNVQSGGQIALTLRGAHVREVFAKGCTLDFHPTVFTPGRCAQSGLAKASVLIGLVSDEEEFIVVVRRSFSDYLVAWLASAV